jgi:hypothetical protein
MYFDKQKVSWPFRYLHNLGLLTIGKLFEVMENEIACICQIESVKVFLRKNISRKSAVCFFVLKWSGTDNCLFEMKRGATIWRKVCLLMEVG